MYHQKNRSHRKNTVLVIDIARVSVTEIVDHRSTTIAHTKLFRLLPSGDRSMDGCWWKLGKTVASFIRCAWGKGGGDNYLCHTNRITSLQHSTLYALAYVRIYNGLLGVLSKRAGCVLKLTAGSMAIKSCTNNSLLKYARTNPTTRPSTGQPNQHSMRERKTAAMSRSSLLTRVVVLVVAVVDNMMSTTTRCLHA